MNDYLSDLNFSVKENNFEVSNSNYFYQTILSEGINEIYIKPKENNTNYIISEDEINEKRLDYLNSEITPIFISILKSEDFEYGLKSESIRIVEENLNINKGATINWFNDLYVKYFTNDVHILIGLLRIVEFLDRDSLNSVGYTMAIASFSHKENEVKELGIRILENWCDINTYFILKNIKIDTNWLQSYINQVIKDFEKELCLSS